MARQYDLVNLLHKCVTDLAAYWRGADNAVDIAEDLDMLVEHEANSNPYLRTMVDAYNANLREQEQK